MSQGKAQALRDRPRPAITLGGEAIALPVVRSLARAGVEMHAAGGELAYDPVGWSRYCSSYTDLGGREGIVERMLEWLSEAAPRDAVLLPCADDGLELCLRHRSELEAMGHVPIEADPEVLAAMLDKELTYSMARAVGVRTPSTWNSAGGAGLDEAIERIGFPCALKPRHSHLWARHFRSRKLYVVDDRAELDELLGQTRELGLEMLITELIPGPESELLSHCGYLDGRGEPLTQFTFRKIRQHPIHFGIGTYVVSDWNEDVIAKGLEFLQRIGLRGLFHVEFKRDPRDGELKLLECNHRLTIESSFAPIDLPRLAYNRVLGLDPPHPRPYRRGIHLWAPYKDALALRDYRRAGELTLGAWLRSLIRPQRFHDFSWRDPRPAIYSHLTLLARKLRTKLPAGRGAAIANQPQ